MKKLNFFLFLWIILLALNDNAFARCECRQPAYRDQIDFLTRYTACLEQCYDSQFESLKLQINAYGKRISDLESQLNRLNSKIKNLEDELSSVKAKE